MIVIKALILPAETKAVAEEVRKYSVCDGFLSANSHCKSIIISDDTHSFAQKRQTAIRAGAESGKKFSNHFTAPQIGKNEGVI